MATVRAIEAFQSERRFTVSGRIDDFWTILKYLDDPIAQLALDLNEGDGFNADIAAYNLRHYLGDQFIRQNPPGATDYEIRRLGRTYMRLPNKAWRDRQNEFGERKFREVQAAIAVAHWDWASHDRRGEIQGRLAYDQITKYHHEVFEKKFQLPQEAFAGTPFGGEPTDWWNKFLGEYVWCRQCDVVEPVRK